MEKAILASLMSLVTVGSGFAQGAITGFNNVQQYVTTMGPLATDPLNATTWYTTGNLRLQVYFSAAATSAQIDEINALNRTDMGGWVAMMLALSEGFQLVSLTGDVSSPGGSVSGRTDADGHLTGFPGTVYLSSQISPNTPGGFVFLFTAVGGYYDTAAGVDAMMGNYGGYPLLSPFVVNPGLTALGNIQNLVLVQVPEANTLALAAFGGTALLLFGVRCRRNI